MGGCTSAQKPKPKQGGSPSPVSNGSTAGGGTHRSNEKAPLLRSDTADESAKDIERILSRMKLFSGLSHEEMKLTAESFHPENLASGEKVIEQGGVGDQFFILQKGSVKVFINDDNGVPQEKNVLQAPCHFGEAALLNDAPRNATIVASGDIHVYHISRKRFQELDLHKKLRFPKRKAVAGTQAATLKGKGAALKQVAPTPKSASQKQLIGTSIMKNESLSALVTLGQPDVDRMVDRMWKQTVDKDDKIIVEGDTVANYFYVVEQGSFGAYKRSSDARKSKTKGDGKRAGLTRVGDIAVGRSFGEVALLYNAPRNASVIADQKSVVWVLDRLQFQKILHDNREEARKAKAAYLGLIKSTKCLVEEERMAVAETFVERIYYKNDVIFRKGKKRDHMVILYSGDFVLEGSGQTQTISARSQGVSTGTSCCSCGLAKMLGRRSSSDPIFIGEAALDGTEDVKETVRVASQVAHGIELKRAAFAILFKKPLKELQKRSSQYKAESQVISFMERMIAPPPPPAASSNLPAKSSIGHISYNELKPLGLLGCGGFGFVELVDHPKTGHTFALKTVSKGFIVKSEMKNSILQEKQILMMLHSAFIVKCFETYTTDQTLCFLLEVALGGELHHVYMTKSLYGSKKHALYYLAGVVLAFEHMHGLHVIYRDLKPENLLLTDKGLIKITDMGLAKQVVGPTYTTCGTPEYFAPEIVRHTGQSVAVDWWCCGILLFEMLTGHAPFQGSSGGDSTVQIYKAIMVGFDRLKLERRDQKAIEHARGSKELIRGLLEPETNRRLPMGVADGGKQLNEAVANLKMHEFFEGFDWNGMEARKLRAPYVPEVKSKKDVNQFQPDEDDKPEMLRYKPDGTNWDKDFACVNPNA